MPSGRGPMYSWAERPSQCTHGEANPSLVTPKAVVLLLALLLLVLLVALALALVLLVAMLLVACAR